MGRVNGIMLAGLAIHGVLVPYGWAYEPWLGVFFGGGAALNLIGLAMMAAGSPRGGASTYIAGCMAFLPIGLVGWYGARKVLDVLAEERMARRREELSG